MGVVTPGNQDLPAAVSIKIGYEYFLLNAKTGIDHKLVEVLAGGGTAGKHKKTEGGNTHGGQYNSRWRKSGRKCSL
jgi:hypothetical protein